MDTPQKLKRGETGQHLNQVIKTSIVHAGKIHVCFQMTHSKNSTSLSCANLHPRMPNLSKRKYGTSTRGNMAMAGGTNPAGITELLEQVGANL